MSSGRDKWEEGGKSSQKGNNAQAGPSGALSNLSRSSVAALGNPKGKGKARGAPVPSGRVLAPTPSDKLSLAVQQHGGGKKVGERAPRRNFYATSVDERGVGDTEPLLASPSSGSASLYQGSSRERRGRKKAALWRDAFRPSKKTVKRWMESWMARWMVLAIIPSVFVSTDVVDSIAGAHLLGIATRSGSGALCPFPAPHPRTRMAIASRAT